MERVNQAFGENSPGRRVADQQLQAAMAMAIGTSSSSSGAEEPAAAAGSAAPRVPANPKGTAAKRRQRAQANQPQKLEEYKKQKDLTKALIGNTPLD